MGSKAGITGREGCGEKLARGVTVLTLLDHPRTVPRRVRTDPPDAPEGIRGQEGQDGP
jgi:hypothetical protein